jgi:hypothetical protein
VCVLQGCAYAHLVCRYVNSTCIAGQQGSSWPSLAVCVLCRAVLRVQAVCWSVLRTRQGRRPAAMLAGCAVWCQAVCRPARYTQHGSRPLPDITEVALWC